MKDKEDMEKEKEKEEEMEKEEDAWRLQRLSADLRCIILRESHLSWDTCGRHAIRWLLTPWAPMNL